SPEALPSAAAEALGRRQVQAVEVLGEHAVAAEARREARQAGTDAGHPRPGNAVGIPVVELRDYLPFEEPEQLLGLGGVPARLAVLAAVADRPAEFGRVGFRPPPVEFREVEPAV